MSEKDRFEWNDDMEFDSDTDGQQEYDNFQDPLDGFADYEDMSDFEDLPDDSSPTADAMEMARQPENEDVKVASDSSDGDGQTGKRVRAGQMKQKRRRGLSAVGMGLLFSISILVVSVGVGGAILFAQGISPSSLWQPGNLPQVDQLLNFTDHPLNILYIVALGVAFLAMLGSYKMARTAAESNARTREAEEMLDSVTALSLDRQEEWQSQDFKDFPPAEAFVIRILGAWRLQEARQKRLMGVEGELHRLDKALAKNSRSDLTGRFDHPAVGRLSDEILRYFDAREVAVQNLEEYESSDRSVSGDIMEAVQESRQWNGATLDTLSVQCASLEKLSEEMDDLARHVEMAAGEARSTEGMTDIIEAIRKDLAGHNPAAGGVDKVSPELNDLVDRGSKLAFQIAMEVARLGPRGERLLPMSQSLEDLTTGFRQLADRINERDTQPESAPGLRTVHKKLETLAVLITDDDQSTVSDMADEVQDFGPAAARISGHMTRLVDGFNQQEDRLVKVGSSLADLTGAEFDSSSIPRKESSEAPVSSLGITRHTKPASGRDSGEPVVEVDPFASSEASFMGGGDTPADPDFSASVLPEPDGPSGRKDAPASGLSLDPEGSGNFSLDSSASGEMTLPGDEEKVYDLEDFGVTMTPEPAAEQEDQVFDLTSFDATSVDAAPESDQDDVFEMDALGGAPVVGEAPAAEDDVFEMDALGGAPVVGEAPAAEDDVFEMDALGGAPVPDEAPAAEEEDVHDLAEFGAEPAGDPVFDLSDFGAKPME